MKKALILLFAAVSGFAQMRVASLPSKAPVVTFRVVFTTGAASDPADKPGVANLTAMMISDGGTKDLTYKQVVDALFPMAASVSSQVDKEMTTFSGATHVDNLDAYYKLFRAMLLEPGWREDDFTRVKDNVLNYLKVSLRGNNDEELGKEVLYNEIYAGTPYGHHNAGAISAIERITLDDLKTFYRNHYTQANLILGVAGGYPQGFAEKMSADLRAKLPQRGGLAGRDREKTTAIQPIKQNRLTIVEKDTRSVAYSFGFPIIVTRSHPDYPALLVAMSYFGPHRLSSGRLFQRLRQARGLNYGDYAYIEYFPNGMFRFEPSPNLARRQQIFQVWIRPVEPDTAVFALRLAMFELNRLVRDGLSLEEFERTREFVSKNINLLTKSKSAELGYSIDSMYYGIPPYNEYIKQKLVKLTRDDVNRAIKRHLRTDRIQFVAVSKDAEALKKKLTSPEASPMTYNSPKPDDILAEDKVVQTWGLHLQPEDVRIVPLEQVFQ
ncbi:MAG TPA: pitrilysin family protein [Bryobacteraceae bacterium]|nr:pitrilysin family protein [Bryobacteraceae bacterium]